MIPLPAGALCLAWIGIFAAAAAAQPASAPPAAAPAAPAAAPKTEKPAEPPAPPAKPPPIMADDDQSGKALYAEEPAIKSRIQRIDAELVALKPAELKDGDWAKEWAGEYYEGDGLGENVHIHLAPKAGIGYLNYGCLGLYGGDHGDVVEVLADGLRLKLRFGRSGGSFLSERVYFVRWGDRRYLVPDWAMLDLVNNYNEGGFGRSAMFRIPCRFVAGESPHRFDAVSPPGRPQLPEQFAKLLRDDGLTLKVTKVSPVARRDVTTGVIGDACTIEFEGGADQGVYLGLEFWYPPEITVMSGKIKITRVDATTCTGTVMAFGSPGQSYKPPTVGETVRTLRDQLPTPPKPAPKTDEPAKTPPKP